MKNKQTSATRIPHPVTLAEAEAAITRFSSVAEHLVGQSDDDDPVAVLRDVVTEWQELRAFREKVMQQHTELSRFFQRK